MKEDIKDELWEVSFTNFVNGLGLECLVALGKIENPLTKKKEPNFKQVRYIIDTLDMIKEKTKGNLTPDEDKFLDELVVYLKMLYVETQGKAQDKVQETAKQSETSEKKVESRVETSDKTKEAKQNETSGKKVESQVETSDKTQETAKQNETSGEEKDG